MTHCDRLNNDLLKDVQIITSGNVTLHGNRDFAGEIKLMVSRWRNLLDYPGESTVTLGYL